MQLQPGFASLRAAKNAATRPQTESKVCGSCTCHLPDTVHPLCAPVAANFAALQRSYQYTAAAHKQQVQHSQKKSGRQVKTLQPQQQGELQQQIGAGKVLHSSVTPAENNT